VSEVNAAPQDMPTMLIQVRAKGQPPTTGLTSFSSVAM
jgi:hypothetical protein